MKTCLVQQGHKGPPNHQYLAVRKKIAWERSFTKSNSTPLPIVFELSSYLDSDTVTCFDDNFNITSWWREHIELIQLCPYQLEILCMFMF